MTKVPWGHLVWDQGTLVGLGRPDGTWVQGLRRPRALQSCSAPILSHSISCQQLCVILNKVLAKTRVFLHMLDYFNWTYSRAETTKNKQWDAERRHGGSIRNNITGKHCKQNVTNINHCWNLSKERHLLKKWMSADMIPRVCFLLLPI